MKTTRYTISENTAKYIDCRRALCDLETAIRNALAADLHEDPNEGPHVEDIFKKKYFPAISQIEQTLTDTITDTANENLFTALRCGNVEEIAL